MSQILRVLLVEDSEDDATLIERALRRAGHRPLACRVVDEFGMRAALDASPWDVVLCDSSMPTFSADAAAALLEEKGADVPLILVTGSPPTFSAKEFDAPRVDRPVVSKNELWRLSGVIASELDTGAVDIDDLVTRAAVDPAWGATSGSVADRIAEELNRMVAIIASSSSALRAQVDRTHPSRRHVEEAERAVLRATELILDAFAVCRSRDEVARHERDTRRGGLLPLAPGSSLNPRDEILEAASLIRLNLEFVRQLVHGEPRAALTEACRALERLTDRAKLIESDDWDDDKTPIP